MKVKLHDRGHLTLSIQRLAMTVILLAIFLTLAACGPAAAPEAENGNIVIADYIKITAAEQNRISA